METRSSIFKISGAPSARGMLTSLAVHVLVLALLMLGAQTLLSSAPTKKERELDIVFYHPPKIAVAAPAVPLSPAPATTPAGAPPGAPAPAVKPRPNVAAGPDRPGKPELPRGPEEGYKAEPPQPEPKPGKVGILAFKDKLASLAQDTIAPRLGAEARRGVADDVGKSSSRSMLTSTTAGSSGGINVAS